MVTLLLIIGLVAALLMIIIVLVQNPKGGGLASNFSSSNQIFGVRRTTEGVEKLTWIFALIILFVSIAAGSMNGTTSSKEAKVKDSKIESLINATPKNNKKQVKP